MAELLKNTFNINFIKSLSRRLSDLDAKFQHKSFLQSQKNYDWDEMELKQRIRAISSLMEMHLSGSYKDQTEVLIAASRHLPGFQSLIFPDYIQAFGLKKKDEVTSLRALKELTKYSTSEFAIRPFIQRDPEKLMNTLYKWSKDKNEHVRRLSSEGCRPRLPWGEQLRVFMEDPAMILPILGELKSDPSDYVRKSVANNLNDISKDHPQVTLDFAEQHWGQDKNTDRVIKHGMRTLLKKADTKALSVVGYNLQAVQKSSISTNKEIKKNQKLKIKIAFKLKTSSLLRVEYKMYFLKANGSYTEKVFKVCERVFDKGEHIIETHYNFKPITTRVYYSGKHFISAVVNGQESKKTGFLLKWS